MLSDKEFVVVFDFLGKDSIRYTNTVAVEKRVFKNLQLFTNNKNPNDDLFDRLNVSARAVWLCTVCWVREVLVWCEARLGASRAKV